MPDEVQQLTPTGTVAITFAVDDVTPAESRLATCKPLEAIRQLIDAPPSRFACADDAQGYPTRGRIERCWNYSQNCVAEIIHHPLIASAHLAFSEHRPLVLSPDVVWVTIVQGLALHLRQNPEAYRSQLVHHKERKELNIVCDDLHRGSPENAWDEVISDLAAQVRRDTGALGALLVADFSTTGPVEKTVSEVVLLDAMQPYFSYNVVCICGIPSVTLEGTPDDWRRLREKVELLAPFDLEWWLSALRPICDQFAKAAVGDIDLAHWQRLYKLAFAYGAELVNGWIAKLFPYLRDSATGHYTLRNELLDPAVEAQFIAEEARFKKAYLKGHVGSRDFQGPGIRAEDFPRGISQVPFTFTDTAAGRRQAMEFLAGPIAVTQESESGALRPILGWAVREASPIEQALLRLSGCFVPAKQKEWWQRFPELHVDYVPSDVIRFYQVAESAQWPGQLPNDVALNILPLSQWTPAGHLEGDRQDDIESRTVRYLHVAEYVDGTAILLNVDKMDATDCGAIFAKLGEGEVKPKTTQKIARSFSDFLLYATDTVQQPYFRRPEYVPLVSGESQES